MMCWYSAIMILLVSWKTLSASQFLFIDSSCEAILLCSLKKSGPMENFKVKLLPKPDRVHGCQARLLIGPGIATEYTPPVCFTWLEQKCKQINNLWVISLTALQLTAPERTAWHEGRMPRPLILVSLGLVFRRGDLASLLTMYILREKS